MTLGAGQFCTKPGLLFIPQDANGDALVTSLVGALNELTTMTMLTADIADHFRSGSVTIAGVDDNSHLVGDDPNEGTSVRPQLFEVPAAVFSDPSSRALREECFGPLAIVIRYLNRDDLSKALASADAALTFSVFTSSNDDDAAWLVELGQTKAGRVIANGFPTGVGVSWSMQHGGPWPATTNSSATSVGASGVDRWLRPVTYQGVPEELLPEALRDANPLAVPQRVDGVLR
jgi:NADP-dependent aldehyde dehydrogenase